MSCLAVRAGMDLPSLPEKHRVHVLLRGRLTPSATVGEPSHAYWPATFFGLTRVRLFREAPAAVQHTIVEHCGRSLLEEAYFIEKSGVSFAASMVLLGESIEERMLYACFANEEARHFDGVRSFLQGSVPQRSDNPFLDLLSEVIGTADRTTLQLVIQVVLEGWGLLHYRGLRDGCLDPTLARLLDGILLDEAGHHGSGRVFFGDTQVDAAALTRIEDALSPLLGMVRHGPQSVLGALDRALGGLSGAQRIRVLDELDGPAEAQRRLDHLRHLLRFESLQPLMGRLQSQGLFSPLRPEDCV